MQSIKLKSHVGSDGILQVHLPEIRNSDVELVVVYQSSAPEGAKTDDLSQFYGCIQDETFIRHPQPVQPLKTDERSLEQLYGICADDPIMIDDRVISE